jgi:hypothetical protein
LTRQCPTGSQFVLGIFHANSKPKNANDYLEDFVKELVELQQTGFFHNGKVIKIVVFGFSCDDEMPLSSLLKITQDTKAVRNVKFTVNMRGA